MNCATCQSENEAENKFCRECGSRLMPKEAEAPPVASSPPGGGDSTEKTAEEPSAEERASRKKRVAELLPRAFAFAEKGALVEAIATAEEAAGLMPGSSAAHALLATLYEKAGQNEKALNCLKKVAELNPDAPLDEERMARLRRARSATAPTRPHPQNDEAPSPVKFWAPRLGAALAFFTVLYGGISIIRLQQEEPVKSPKTLMVSERRAGATGGVQPNSPARPVFAPPPVGGSIDPFVSKSGWHPQTAAPAVRQTVSRTERRGDSTPSVRRRSSLPRPDSSDGEAAPSGQVVPPVNVTFPATVREDPPESERISAGPPPSAPTQKSPGNDGGDGYIRIETHPASGNSSSSSADEGTKGKEKSGGDPVSEAQALQNAGRYRDALNSWREVLASSGTRGEVFQNVGLCYQRLGERGAARDAYSRAINVYQGQVQRGSAAEAAQRGIESCRAALEVLGV